ncbi:MAG: mycofactocin-associated electron transfer flavoprotein alpha subunit [Ilumatobacteraceae bacterium]
MLSLLPIRQGMNPAGFGEAVSECGGRVLLIGEGCRDAATQLRGIASEITIVEAGTFAPAAWARFLAIQLGGEDIIVFSASPDGRDLAPRLAFELGVSLYAGAVRVTAQRVDLAQWGGQSIESLQPESRFVATLQIGARDVVGNFANGSVVELEYVTDKTSNDSTFISTTPPDAASVDLAEAPRIVTGGAGISDADIFAKLGAVATALGASLGATRVVTDRGWVDHARQIGTTGVIVAPRLYIACAVSGAVQHTSGIGQPQHIISINTDPSCPMMRLADLAVVGDVNEIIVELESLLTVNASAT